MESLWSHNADSHLEHGETGPIPRFIKGNQLFREEDIPEVVAIHKELERANPEWKTDHIRVTPQRMSNDGANVCESNPLLWFRMGYYMNTYNFATLQDMGCFYSCNRWRSTGSHFRRRWGLRRWWGRHCAHEEGHLKDHWGRDGFQRRQTICCLPTIPRLRRNFSNPHPKPACKLKRYELSMIHRL